MGGRAWREQPMPGATRSGGWRRAPADAGLAGHACLGQRSGTRFPPPHRRRCDYLLTVTEGREQHRRRAHPLSFLPDLPAWPAAHARVLHSARGTDRRHGRGGPQELHYADLLKDGGTQNLQRYRRLDRHHRQVLGRRADPRSKVAYMANSSGHQREQRSFSDRFAVEPGSQWRRAAKAAPPAICLPAPNR